MCQRNRFPRWNLSSALEIPFFVDNRRALPSSCLPEPIRAISYTNLTICSYFSPKAAFSGVEPFSQWMHGIYDPGGTTISNEDTGPDEANICLAAILGASGWRD